MFWPAAAIAVVFILFALLMPATAESVFGSVQSAIVSGFNWYYVLIAAFFVIFALAVGFSRFGSIKLGSDDDEPEFSLMSWFSLLFAAGMGIGLVFYGVSEPLSHFADPRPGVTGTETQLAQSALSQTYLHWGVHAWSIYVVVGLALAYAFHRRKRPMTIRWALEPVLGARVRGGWGNAIDVAALVGTIFGVATSLGLGVLQISAGLESTGTIEAGPVVQLVIIAVITVFVLFSVLSGVARGMKWFSVLGGSALFMQLTGEAQLVGPDGVDVEGSLFAMLANVPGSAVLTVGFLILIGIFFVTSADSGALVMSMIATGGAAEPRRWIKVFFTLATTLIAVALLFAGGLQALQTAAIIIALPFSVVMLAMCWATVVAFRRERRAYDRAEREQFREQIGQYYGLEVEEPIQRGVFRRISRAPRGPKT